MKYFLIPLLILCVSTGWSRTPNYDESKVAPYLLEDPLTFANGEKLNHVSEWPKRRKEILSLFEAEMYGKIPPPPQSLQCDTFEEGPTLAGFGIRRQIRMRFGKPEGPKVDWLVLLPRTARGPVPAILFLNYGGNQEILPDTEIPVTDGWLRNNPSAFRENHRASERSRGALCKTNADSIVPASMILARGYALVTACYGEISPDPQEPELQEKIAYTGLFSLWPPRDPQRTDHTTALGAWAWTLMRGLDLIERIPELDAKRVVVTGCSRLGKAALIAGAWDERFAIVAPNQTGGGGVPLAKRNFGENVATETKMFTHWYCKAYSKYADQEHTLPFDQHLLLAAIAPRPLFVQGFNAPWFDTKGEYLACRAASPAWVFLGKPGLPNVPFPSSFDTSCIGPRLAYYRRDGKHGIAAIDWTLLLQFSDCFFNSDRKEMLSCNSAL